MAHYRIYTVGQDGHFTGPPERDPKATTAWFHAAPAEDHWSGERGSMC
jgi:hypothetical protein